MLAKGSQGIGIKESVAAQGDTGEKSVIKNSLKHIDIFGLAAQEEHPIVPERVGDGDACFGVGAIIRKFIVGPESFPVACGTDASR